MAELSKRTTILPVHQERKEKPWIRNPFMPDRPIAYDVEFAELKSVGVRPDFYRIGNHIYEQARSQPGQTFIINNRCSDGAKSLKYYLMRGAPREGVTVIEDLDLYSVGHPKTAVEAFAFLAKCCKAQFDPHFDTNIASADDFKIVMRNLAKRQPRLLLFIKDFDSLIHPQILNKEEAHLLTRTLKELAQDTEIKLSLVLDIQAHRHPASTEILGTYFQDEMLGFVQLPNFSEKDMGRMAQLMNIPDVAINPSGLQQLFYFTGGHPRLTQLLFFRLHDRLTHGERSYIGGLYPEEELNYKKVVKKEVKDVAVELIRDYDWRHFFWNILGNFTGNEQALMWQIYLRTRDERSIIKELYRSQERHLFDLGIFDTNDSRRYTHPDAIRNAESQYARNYKANWEEVFAQQNDIMQKLLEMGFVQKEPSARLPDSYSFGPALLLWFLGLRNPY